MSDALRWDCKSDGCFNTLHRPKFEVFSRYLPGKIRPTDVDFTVEINGNFLFVEFKSGEPRDLPVGQRLYFQRLTMLSPKVTAVIACANAETMEVSFIRTISGGFIAPWVECDLSEMQRRLSIWAKSADQIKGEHE